MARNRAFIRLPAVRAAGMPPPAVTTDSAANWAEPANTIIAVTLAWATLNPACRASTPKETLRKNPTAAKGSPSRRPRRKEACCSSPPSALTGAG